MRVTDHRSLIRTAGRLDGPHGACPRAFALSTAALIDFEFDRLPLRQIVETTIGHTRMVKEHVFTVRGLNETKAFVLNDLLHFAFRHLTHSYVV